MTLDPHVLLVTDPGTPSSAARRLREGGYLVTKVAPLDASTMIEKLAPDAVVADVSAGETMRLLRGLAGVRQPLLVITAAPKMFDSRYVLRRADIDEEMIPMVDRMLVSAA